LVLQQLSNTSFPIPRGDAELNGPDAEVGNVLEEVGNGVRKNAVVL
jgi:hypothetical protein